jgi:hypothetical protein
MVDMKDRSSLERLLRPLRRELNAEFAAALLRMQADDELQTRYEYLAERNTEGLLDPRTNRAGFIGSSEHAAKCVKGRGPRFSATSHRRVAEWMSSYASLSVRGRASAVSIAGSPKNFPNCASTQVFAPRTQGCTER